MCACLRVTSLADKRLLESLPQITVKLSLKLLFSSMRQIVGTPLSTHTNIIKAYTLRSMAILCNVWKIIQALRILILVLCMSYAKVVSLMLVYLKHPVV